MSWIIRTTEDIEMAVVAWQAANPQVGHIIGRNEAGVWWNDETGSTHLTEWDEIRGFIS